MYATAPSAESTDFTRIAQLYDRLAQVVPSPVVDVNHAAAVGFADGPDAGLALLDRLVDTRLEGYHLLYATRAHLLRQAGRDSEALRQYARAIELAPTEPERRLLIRRMNG